MKILIAMLFILRLSTPLFAVDTKYRVSDIPDSLKEGMYAVVRESNTSFEILAINKSVERIHKVITILNAKAKSEAIEHLWYDKTSKITLLKGYAYDASGNEVKRLKQSEIKDQSAISGYSLYEDDRVKIADLSLTIYPYTVEFEYEIEFEYLYSVPGFILHLDDEISIQNISYNVIYPKQLAPRFKLTMVADGSKTQLPGGRESVTWNFQNKKPKKFEPYSPSIRKVIPNIMAGPSEFQYGAHGNMSSWKSYGTWEALLNKDRDALPEATKDKIRSLTRNLSTTEEKAKKLYEYMQGKTRYVSIQLGVGGMQTFPASVVDETGYGDCKALSNYMVAMLKEVGIKGYYTSVRAGDNAAEVIRDFPSHQANHVIVAVPNGRDTLWMECTNQTVPFGYMGNFTGDRYALMVTEDGGKLVKTPSYSAEQNLKTRTAKVDVDLAGDAKAQVVTTYRGTQYESGDLNFRLEGGFDDQKKWVLNNTKIPVFTLNKFSMTQVKDKIPSATVTLDLSLNKYASVSGKRIFISPNLMNKSSLIPEKMLTRKNDVVQYSNFTDIDTIRFTFPENLYPEFLPQPSKITSRFGEYETKYEFNGGKLVYIRRMKVWKGTFPKESYSEFVDFYKNVSKADNTKLVLLSKT